MRRTIALVVALLALTAPVALAQDPFDDPMEPEPTTAPDVTATPDEADPDPEPEATATPEGCDDRGAGTDGDYAYCPGICADDESTDADYVYCVQADSGGGPPVPKRKRTSPASAIQPLPAQQLPLTGSEPWLIAACGAGFLMAGAGLRLRARPR